jgi:hypothetical protein
MRRHFYEPRPDRSAGDRERRDYSDPRFAQESNRAQRDEWRTQEDTRPRDVRIPEEYDDPREDAEDERRIDEFSGGGRVGGASGYGAHDRIIGQTASSMLLGQEGGWHEIGPRIGTRPAIGWGTEHRNDFRGRGPKGYERSDERLLEIICERLTEDSHVDASDIEVQVTNKEVSLTGTVRDRWSKHHIEDVVAECSGVTEIHNQLRVAGGSTP